MTYANPIDELLAALDGELYRGSLMGPSDLTHAQRASDRAGRRRTKSETRELLLDGGLRVLERRVAGEGTQTSNPLADVRITDALGEANAALRDADGRARPMTTGAAYNIWPHQAGFQSALLERVLLDTAVPGFTHVREVVVTGLNDRRPWETVLAQAFEADYDESFASPAMFAMLGLAALSPRDDFAAGQAEANAVYVREVGDLLETIMRYARRRLRDACTLEDLVWAIEGLESGLLLRRRLQPDVPLRRGDGDRTMFATAVLGVFTAFTEGVD